MNGFAPPEGFLYDANTGYYYKQEVISNGLSQPYTVIYWFNPRTGQITQNTLQQPAGQYAPPMQQQPAGQYAPPMQQQTANQFVQPLVQQPAGRYAQPAAQKPVGKKGGKIAGIICIVVLLCTLAGVGSVLVYKQFFAEDTEEKNVETTKETSVTEADENSEEADAEPVEYKYAMKEEDVFYDVYTSDGKAISKLTVTGLGNIDQPLPKGNGYKWIFTLDSVDLVIEYDFNPAESENSCAIYAKDMDCSLKYMVSAEEKTIEGITFKVENDKITFYDFEIPADANFGGHTGNWSNPHMVTLFNFYRTNLSVSSDPQVYKVIDVPFAINGVDKKTLLEENNNEKTTESAKTTENKNTTEAATTAQTTAEAATDGYIDYGIGWIEGDYIGTDENLQGAQPTISINGNGHMVMNLNFGEGFNSYNCYYETSGRKSEQDELYVYVTVENPSNGIPSTCTLVFSDSCDYFLFLDEGFGIMGYSGAPYCFSRV